MQLLCSIKLDDADSFFITFHLLPCELHCFRVLCDSLLSFMDKVDGGVENGHSEELDQALDGHQHRPVRVVFA